MHIKIKFRLCFSLVEYCYIDNVDCRNGICVDPIGKCDGFNDCLNFVDEKHCGK